MLTFSSDVCHPPNNAALSMKHTVKWKKKVAIFPLKSYKKSKHKIRITKCFLGPNTWAKSIINWLAAKIHFTVFFDDTANADKGVIRRQVWNGTENYFLKLSIYLLSFTGSFRLHLNLFIFRKYLSEQILICFKRTHESKLTIQVPWQHKAFESPQGIWERPFELAAFIGLTAHTEEGRAGNSGGDIVFSPRL